MDGDISLFFAWGVILLVAGAAFTAIFGSVWLLVRRRVRVAARLRQTPGKLIEADVSRGQIRSGPSRFNYMPVGRYEYVVAGKAYTGQRISLQVHGFVDEARARAEFGGKKAGDVVTVFYDPDSPGWSAINGTPPVVARWFRYGTVIAAAAAVAGLILVITG